MIRECCENATYQGGLEARLLHLQKLGHQTDRLAGSDLGLVLAAAALEGDLAQVEHGTHGVEHAVHLVLAETQVLDGLLHLREWVGWLAGWLGGWLGGGGACVCVCVCVRARVRVCGVYASAKSFSSLMVLTSTHDLR